MYEDSLDLKKKTDFSSLVHTSVLTMPKFEEVKYKFLGHPAYFSNLIHIDSYTFLKLNMPMVETVFQA